MMSRGEIRMQCPFCKDEMKEGVLSIEQRRAEFRESPTRYIGLRYAPARPIRTGWFKIEKEKAWCCPECKKIILDYSEKLDWESDGGD